MTSEDLRRNPEEFSSWGEQPLESTYHTINYYCRCGEFKFPDALSSGRAVGKYAVGFQAEPGFGKAGKVVVECPHCHEKNWFHISPRAARELLES